MPESLLSKTPDRFRRNKQLLSIGAVLLLLITAQAVTIALSSDSVSDWLNRLGRNWLNILLNNAYVGMIALGMTFVIISGGIDLAVGSTLVAVGAFVMALINTQSTGILQGIGITGVPAILIAVLLGILLSLALGGINAAVITAGNVPPFIVTLGTMKIYRSVTQFLTQRVTGVTLPDDFKMISRFSINGIMLLPILYWAALAAILYMVSRYTVFGRHVYAVGSNEKAARLSGINTNWVKAKVYLLMGLMVGAAAIVQIARIGSMDYASAGSGYEMDAIAAVIIGGTSMAGGRGSIAGTVLGTLILATVNNLLTLAGVDPFLREAFKGAIVVVAVLLQRKEKS